MERSRHYGKLRNALYSTAIAAALVSCGSEQNTDSPQNPSLPNNPNVIRQIDTAPGERSIKRDDGIWSREDMRILSDKLRAEKDLPTLMAAGETIAKNLKGEASVSVNNRFFVEDQNNDKKIDPFRIITVAALVDNQGNPLANSVSITGMGRTYRFAVENGAGTVIESKPDLYMNDLKISEAATRNFSDKALEFFMAIQFGLPEAYRDLADVFVPTAAKNLYAQEPDKQDALQLAYLQNALLPYEGLTMPTAELPTYFANFRVVPDYMKAKDIGILTVKDQNSLAPLDKMGSKMVEINLLTKSEDGNYNWSKQGDELTVDLANLAVQIYNGKDITLASIKTN